MANSDNVKIACNWLNNSENDLSSLVKTQLAAEDIFQKPDVEQIVNEERAILLTRRKDEQDACKLQLVVEAHNKIAAVSLACTAPKLEVYLGSMMEYSETYFGEEIETGFSYVYHIEIQRSGITELELKFITADDNICIFGIIMQTAPNPNGITTQQGINMGNVQEMLSSIDENFPRKAEKCNMFLRMMSRVQQLPSTEENTATSSNAKELVLQLSIMENGIKEHIDKRFTELETKINAQFDRINANYKQIFDALQMKQEQ